MPRKDAQFTVEDIEYAATRAGQLVYGNDRLDDLIEELNRFLDEVARKAGRS